MKVFIVPRKDILTRIRLYVSSDAFIVTSLTRLAAYVDELSGPASEKVRAVAEVALACLDSEYEFVTSSSYSGFGCVVSKWLWDHRPIFAKAAIAIHTKKPLPKLNFPSWEWEDFRCAESEPLKPSHALLLSNGVNKRPQIKKYLSEMVPYFERIPPGDRRSAIEKCVTADQAKLREMFENHITINDLEVDAQEVEDAFPTPEEITEAKEYFFAVLPTVEKPERNAIYRQLGLARPPRGADAWAELLSNFTQVYVTASASGRRGLTGEGTLDERIREMCVSCA